MPVWDKITSLFISAKTHYSLKFANPMKKTKQKNNQGYDSSSEQQQPKNSDKTLSQYRDYMSMKVYSSILKNRKKEQNKPEKVQKHSNVVHAHLQPLQPQEPMFEEEEEAQIDRDDDPVNLLKNFSKENYKGFMRKMREMVANEKPYSEENYQFIQALAMKRKNVCIYGYGSKIQYIRNTVFDYLGDHFIWVINGFKNSISDKKIFNSFGKFLRDTGIATNKLQKITMNDQLVEYHDCLDAYQQHNKKPIVVIFHCLDALPFMSADAQRNLSLLFCHKTIKLICSIDSIKICSIWHPRVKTNFNFRFIQIDTMVPNIEQQYYRPNTTDIREQSDQAIMNIYQASNNNQKRILKLFAKRQLQNLDKDKQQHQYYTLNTLLEQCIDNVIFTNDTQLRQNLLQLLDHKVIVSVEKYDPSRTGNQKYYTMKCNKGILDRIYKQKIEQ